jgi:hypothetical protein
MTDMKDKEVEEYVYAMAGTGDLVTNEKKPGPQGGRSTTLYNVNSD